MAKRSILTLMTALLVAIGAFVYLSPAAPSPALRAAEARAQKIASANLSVTHGAVPVTTTDSAVRRAAQRKARANARPNGRDRLDGPPRTITKTKTVVVHRNHTVYKSVAAPATAPGAPATNAAASADLVKDITAPPVPRAPTCTDFKWQQDAQAAYVQNLADPYGLDGAVGPLDDDGIACSLLPVDPGRPASTPAGAKPPPPPKPPAPEAPPTTPTMQQLLSPDLNYFGVSTPQAPFDWKDYELFVNAAKKRPNLLMFFSGWDRDYPSDKIVSTWRRQMLPVITWEPRSTVQASGDTEDAPKTDGLTLASIINGEHDDYITKYAQDVAKLGLPVGIRFAHEMNGPWYPWSEQSNGNHSGEFVQAWRHVHDIFTANGATNAIWIWSPSRVDPYPNIDLHELYPGDDYVDWLGMTGYFRHVEQTPGFDKTFGQTLTAFQSIAQKPVFLSEVGATESGNNGPKKVAWIKDMFEGIKANPQIIGFSWFDQSIDGNDWRIESSSAATSAFADGVGDPSYGAGVWQPR
jgi:hypothetical protein